MIFTHCRGGQFRGFAIGPMHYDLFHGIRLAKAEVGNRRVLGAVRVAVGDVAPLVAAVGPEAYSGAVD